jgi:hypothetical protein
MLSETWKRLPSRVVSQKAMPSLPRTKKRDQEGEVDDQPAVPPLREISLQLWKILVSGDVADLHRLLAAHSEGARQRNVAARVAEHPEGVGTGVAPAVVEAVADQDRRGLLRRRAGSEGDEKQRRGFAHRFSLYSASQRVQVSIALRRLSGGIPGT